MRHRITVHRHGGRGGKQHKKVTIGHVKWWFRCDAGCRSIHLYSWLTGAVPCWCWCTPFARPVTRITRLRLDAALYEPVALRRVHQTGRPRLKGKRLPTLQHLRDPATQGATVTVPRWIQPRGA
jgi:hypothetical protein